MKQIESWPPPNWTEVVVLWEEILKPPGYPIKQILEWIVHAPGDEFHLHGYRSTEGFSFRFRNPKDAMYFKLRWL